MLFVSREYPPFEVGGVSKHTFYLVKHLRKLGVTCKVVSFGNSAMSDDSTIFVDPSSSVISKESGTLKLQTRVPLDIMHFERFVNELIKKEGFDIVHIEEPYVGGSIKHPRKITTIHDTSYGEVKTMFNQSNFQDLKRMVFYFSFGVFQELKCIESSRAIIVPASHIFDEVANVYHAGGKNLIVIRNGVEIPGSFNKNEAKKKLNISGTRIVIFTAAQHIVRKRLQVLIQAIKILVDSGFSEQFTVVIAGDGPLSPALKGMTAKLGLNKVIEFPGWVSEENLKLYYEAADIFVLTSEYEAGPISLLEAGSYGDCVISSKIEGFPRLMLHGSDGLLYKVGDPQALSGLIKQVLGDANLRQHLSEGGRSFALRFSWDKVAEETKNLYKKCMA